MVDASERQCAQARADLQRRYGTPVDGGESAGGRYDSWNSDKDAVVFIYRSDPGPRCLVLMSPSDLPKSDPAPPTALLAWLR